MVARHLLLRRLVFVEPIRGPHTTRPVVRGRANSRMFRHETSTRNWPIACLNPGNYSHLSRYHRWRGCDLANDSSRDEILWNLSVCSVSNFASPSEL